MDYDSGFGCGLESAFWILIITGEGVDVGVLDETE
jgi:hypothetical protein